MIGLEQLVEQHVRVYESRLRGMDEIVERAQRAATATIAEIEDELAVLRRERLALAARMAELRRNGKAEWQNDEIERAGPMIMWQVVAKRLEQMMERLERQPQQG